MNTSISKILQGSFKLFMTLGYERTSLELLQKETHLSRGAIYHYFSNKNEIFDAVIEKYLLGTISFFVNIDASKKRSLLETIDFCIEKRKKDIDYLKKITDFEADDYQYFKLIFIANEHHSDFNRKVNNLNKIDMQYWIYVLKNAIKIKEISNKIDIETTALNLMTLPQGVGLASAFNDGINASIIKNAYYEYYKLLK